jgi:hypothetical protein
MLTTLERTAHHEAAHGVIGVVLGCTVRQVSIVENGEALGMTQLDIPTGSPALRAAVLLSGPISEARASGNPVSYDARPEGDLHMALQPFIDAGYSESAATRVISQCSGLAELLVRDNWAAIGSVARLLEQKDCLGRDELHRLVARFSMESEPRQIERMSWEAARFPDSECLENGPEGYRCKSCGQAGKVHVLKKSGRLLCASCCPCAKGRAN